MKECFPYIKVSESMCNSNESTQSLQILVPCLVEAQTMGEYRNADH